VVDGALHQVEGLEILRRLQQVQRCHLRAVIRQQEDEPLRGEPDQRLADRRARHAERLDQPGFVELGARPQFHLQDAGPQGRVDELRAAAFRLPRREFRDLQVSRRHRCLITSGTDSASCRVRSTHSSLAGIP
jgi:hypothetical protein